MLTPRTVSSLKLKPKLLFGIRLLSNDCVSIWHRRNPTWARAGRRTTARRQLLERQRAPPATVAISFSTTPRHAGTRNEDGETNEADHRRRTAFETINDLTAATGLDPWVVSVETEPEVGQFGSGASSSPRAERRSNEKRGRWAGVDIIDRARTSTRPRHDIGSDTWLLSGGGGIINRPIDRPSEDGRSEDRPAKQGDDALCRANLPAPPPLLKPHLDAGHGKGRRTRERAQREKGRRALVLIMEKRAERMRVPGARSMTSTGCIDRDDGNRLTFRDRSFLLLLLLLLHLLAPSIRVDLLLC